MTRLYDRRLTVAPFLVAPTSHKEAGVVLGPREIARVSDRFAEFIMSQVDKTRSGLPLVAQLLILGDHAIAVTTIQTTAQDKAGRRGLHVTYGMLLPRGLLGTDPTVLSDGMTQLATMLESTFSVKLDRAGTDQIANALYSCQDLDTVFSGARSTELLDWFEERFKVVQPTEHALSEIVSAGLSGDRLARIRIVRVQTFAAMANLDQHWKALEATMGPTTSRSLRLRRLSNVAGAGGAGADRALLAASVLVVALVALAYLWDAPQSLPVGSSTVWQIVRLVPAVMIVLAAAEECLRWNSIADMHTAADEKALPANASSGISRTVAILAMLGTAAVTGFLLLLIGLASLIDQSGFQLPF